MKEEYATETGAGRRETDGEVEKKEDEEAGNIYREGREE